MLLHPVSIGNGHGRILCSGADADASKIAEWMEQDFEWTIIEGKRNVLEEDDREGQSDEGDGSLREFEFGRDDSVIGKPPETGGQVASQPM